jgi:tetratricopeptide (TPR) repeat protein
MTSLLQQLYPQGIGTIFERRLKRVPEAMRPLLPGAALAGRQLDPVLLQQLIVQLDASINLDDWLIHCVAAVVLEMDKGQWRFADEALRLDLLDALNQAEQQFWHQQIATAMETVYAHDLAHAHSLAYHWQQVGNISKEQRYARLAGAYAYQQYAHDSAVNHFCRALALTLESNLTEQYELLLAREQAYHWLGKRDEQKDDLTALAEISDRLSTESGLELKTEVALRLGFFAEVTGEYTVAIVAATEALHLAESTQIPAHVAASHLLWGQALLRQGKYDEAQQKLQSGLTHAQTYQVDDVVAHSLRFLGVMANDLGQFDHAKHCYDQALSLYHTLQDKRGESAVLNNLSVVAYAQNRLVAALDHWEEARQIYEVIGDKQGSARVLSNLSSVAMDLGDYELGRAYSEEALALCRDIDLRFGQGFNLINLSLFSFYLHEDQQAEIYSLAALKLAREMGSHSLEGMALKDRAYILTHRQAWAEAVQTYQQALIIWQDLSQPLQILEAQSGLARVALHQGDLELAQAHIQPMITYLQAGNTAMGMSRPFYIYLICVELLTVSDDPYAATLLQQAHAELTRFAENISDELRRHACLENVADHRQIRTLFNQTTQPG